MDKPKKKIYYKEHEKLTGIKPIEKEKVLHGIYCANQMWEEWEAWLKEIASEEKIEKIIKKDRKEHCLLIHSILAKAISRSILGDRNGKRNKKI